MAKRDVIPYSVYQRRFTLPVNLRRNELSREAKREHLASGAASGRRIVGEEADRILDELYGPEVD